MDSSGIRGQGGQALVWPICHEIMPKRQSVCPSGGGLASCASFALPASSQEPGRAPGAQGGVGGGAPQPQQGRCRALAQPLEPEPRKES